MLKRGPVAERIEGVVVLSGVRDGTRVMTSLSRPWFEVIDAWRFEGRLPPLWRWDAMTGDPLYMALLHRNGGYIGFWMETGDPWVSRHPLLSPPSSFRFASVPFKLRVRRCSP